MLSSRPVTTYLAAVELIADFAATAGRFGNGADEVVVVVDEVDRLEAQLPLSKRAPASMLRLVSSLALLPGAGGLKPLCTPASSRQSLVQDDRVRPFPVSRQTSSFP